MSGSSKPQDGLPAYSDNYSSAYDEKSSPRFCKIKEGPEVPDSFRKSSPRRFSARGNNDLMQQRNR